MSQELSDERIKVVADEETRLAAPDGTTTIVLKPGVETEIHPKLHAIAFQAGVRVLSGNAEVLTDEQVVDALVQAMRDILAEGDERHVTKAGVPRFGSLKARCPAFTEEQRAAAWDIVLSDVELPAEDEHED